MEEVDEVGAFFVGVATAVIELSVAYAFFGREFGKDVLLDVY